MALTPKEREELKRKARGKCQKCGGPLGSDWEAHRTDRSKPHTPSVVEAFCHKCHKETPTYGKRLR